MLPSPALARHRRLGVRTISDSVRNPVGNPDGAKDARLAELCDWLESLTRFPEFTIEPASGDASFRRYFRVKPTDPARIGESWIAMDAPPEQEDSLPFVRVGTWLESMGLNVPEVLASDLDAGFLLLSDLGSTLYLDVLDEHPGRAAELYGDALAALHVMQRDGAAWERQLPPFDEPFIRRELALFHDWLCVTHLGFEWTSTADAQWAELSNLLINAALDQPVVFVHRDYHSRNLMVTETNNPGILDFQDAVAGPLTYDLVSLLKDCYITWPSERVTEWATRYYDGLDPLLRRDLPRDRFLRDFALMGVQRHLKAAGIFARLKHRDGKHGYIKDIPRTLAYIQALESDIPELGFLCGLIEDVVLPGLDADA